MVNLKGFIYSYSILGILLFLNIVNADNQLNESDEFIGEEDNPYIN
jgi:hypothetical protein